VKALVLRGFYKADEVVPMFSPLLLGEPGPINGRLKLPETPGFGVELNPDVELVRPLTRTANVS
jgi:L-rhamnonate dehydratase